MTEEAEKILTEMLDLLVGGVTKYQLDAGEKQKLKKLLEQFRAAQENPGQ